MNKKFSPLTAIFITVFLDLLSFGVFIPDIQVRGDALGASGWVRGLLIAVFSIAQFITAPILGRLSDVKGRRMVLVVTTILSILSYVVYGFATTLWVMFVSRILNGIAGANVGVAFAYVADITKLEERSKGMGIIGAAFGMGFVLGPPIGILLLEIGHKSAMTLGLGGAILALVNLIFVLKYLPEPERHSDTSASEFSLQKLKSALSTPGLSILLMLFFAFNFGFSNLESTYMVLSTKEFQWPQSQAGLVLVLVGVVMAFMQGYLIGKLTPKLGEVKLLRIGMLIVAPMVALVPFALPFWVHLIGVVALGIGSGMTSPSLSSLISRSAPKEMQGGIFGVTQGLGAFARMVSPLIANTLYDVKYYYPYLLGGFIIMIPAIAALRIKPSQFELHKSEDAELGVVAG